MTPKEIDIDIQIFYNIHIKQFESDLLIIFQANPNSGQCERMTYFDIQKKTALGADYLLGNAHIAGVLRQ